MAPATQDKDSCLSFLARGEKFFTFETFFFSGFFSIYFVLYDV
jgi:hypothetical protein